MKVLAISSSPRKSGNSDLPCNQFLKGAAEAGHNVEKLQLAEWDIRCYAQYTEIRDKRFYFIVTSADPQHTAAEEAIAGLRGFLRYLPGAEEKGTVYGTGAWDKGDVLRHPAYEKAFEMGKSI